MIVESREHPVFTDEAIRYAFELWMGEELKNRGCRWDGHQYSQNAIRLLFKGFCKGFQTGEEMTWEVDTAPESILCFPNPAEPQGEGGE